MIHGGDEGSHDAADTLGLLRIERVMRGPGVRAAYVREAAKAQVA